LALASPGFVWAATQLYEMPFQLTPALYLTSKVAASFALIAAGAGALSLIEMLVGPRRIFWVAYAVLAASVLYVSFSMIAGTMGWRFSSALYLPIARTIIISSAIVEYGAISAAAVLLCLRRDIEFWAPAVVGFIGIFFIYTSVDALFFVHRGPEVLLFLKPVIMLVGGAAVWRIGSILNSQVGAERLVSAPALEGSAQ
jgi:drug/metabolite transporter (DMT)-like permease